MEAQLIQWSPDQQKDLASQLVGYWAQDEWQVEDCPIGAEKPAYNIGKVLTFNLTSPALKVEIKYACWQKLEQKEWSPNTLWLRIGNVNRLTRWLNAVAPDCPSLLSRSLPSWELSLRSYLIEENSYHLTPNVRVDSNQQQRRYVGFNNHLTVFRQVYKTLVKAYDDRDEYDKDVWDGRVLGTWTNLSKSNYRLNFTRLSQPWLKEAGKQFIRFSLAASSHGECVNRLATLSHFSKFLRQKHPEAGARTIDRSLIVDYVGFLAASGLHSNTRARYLSQMRTFLELCAREGWLPVPDRRLIYSEDIPKHVKGQPRFIPEEVLQQLNQHLDELPPVFARMALVIQECGMRIGELCRMRFDCLSQDVHGDYFLTYYQYKLKKDHCIPISKEIAAVIREQQQETREQYPDFPFLFAARREARKGSPIKQRTFSNALNQLAYDKDIRDASGKPWHFQAHQFRHSLGTRMVNLGLPLHIMYFM